jgi:hypothetical protein
MRLAGIEKDFCKMSFEGAASWLNHDTHEIRYYRKIKDSPNNEGDLIKVFNLFGLNDNDESVNFLLSWAVEANKVDVAQWAVDNGADINGKSTLPMHSNAKRIVAFVNSMKMFDFFDSHNFVDDEIGTNNDLLKHAKNQNKHLQVQDEMFSVFAKWNKRRSNSVLLNETNEAIIEVLKNAKTLREVSGVLKDVDISKKMEDGGDFLCAIAEKTPEILHHAFAVKRGLAGMILNKDKDGVSNAAKVFMGNESKILFSNAFAKITQQQAKDVFKEVIRIKIKKDLKLKNWDGFVRAKNIELIEEKSAASIFKATLETTEGLLENWEVYLNNYIERNYIRHNTWSNLDNGTIEVKNVHQAIWMGIHTFHTSVEKNSSISEEYFKKAIELDDTTTLKYLKKWQDNYKSMTPGSFYSSTSAIEKAALKEMIESISSYRERHHLIKGMTTGNSVPTKKRSI